MYAPRIMRCLMTVGKVNEEIIERHVMVQKETVMETLHQMHAKNYVDMMIVPKRSDYQAKNCIFLWSVDIDKAHSILVDRFFKSILNLIVHRDFLQSKFKVS